MQLTIASFNLRHDRPDPDDRDWRVRCPAVVALLKHHRPDAIGTQEGKANQLLDLHRMLPEYQSVGCDRANTGKDEHCAIFFRRDRLRCLSATDFALSDTPDAIGSMTSSWSTRMPRMATLATFALNRFDGRIVFCNTHLDHESEIARKNGAALIRDRLASHTDARDFWLLSGDFNDEPESAPRATFLEPFSGDRRLDDAIASLPPPRQKSMHRYTGIGDTAIDTIYYDNRWQLTSAWVENKRWLDLLPSDHFPVFAKFEI
ncbi:metal-dependent hydrolase [Rubidibacter lacunae KORDI 51-2]|uniref:Metal-dependent hydrolase n=1 Tax=Rubidibacter lacunae KORDI 51-2 TaxID=582515 RepID=U5DLX3_9CHRO|nr:endonuclease/exonuclease/phosphatase family protein [Rubidibacter lacunae]ERN41574.1 metal-dependent hydrolase [Rubidibacter lacunae KORDI 51-2]